MSTNGHQEKAMKLKNCQQVGNVYTVKIRKNPGVKDVLGVVVGTR